MAFYPMLVIYDGALFKILGRRPAYQRGVLVLAICRTEKETAETLAIIRAGMGF